MPTTDEEYLSESRGPVLLPTMWTLAALTTVFVAARIFVRVWMVRRPGIDDGLIIMALVLIYLYAGLSTAAVSAGYGKHSAALEVPDMENAIMLSIAGYAPGVFSFVLPKFAVVWLLTHTLNPPHRTRLALWSLTGLSAVLILGCVIILFAQCQPSRALWTVTLTTAKCWSPWVLIDYAIVAGSISAMVDLVLAIYPATVLWQLQMHWKKKLALSIALGLGAVACVVAIYKCTQLPSLSDKSDYTFHTADLILWTCIESSMITMAACIPVLAPLVDLVLGRRALSSKDHTPYYHNSYPLSSGGHHSEAGTRLHNTVNRGKNHMQDAALDVTREDASSQENILGSGSNTPYKTEQGRIRRTDVVTVQFEPNE